MDINITRALECSEIFSLLGKKTEELVNTMERVELKPGEMLFVQGSTADCMYILTEGLLAATVRDKLGFEKIAVTIRCGQTVGESGVISSQPRPLTIKALRHSVLLKLTRNVFESYFMNEPKILLKLLNYLSTRSLRAIETLENIYPYVNIAFVPANPQVNIDVFFQNFFDLFQQQKKLGHFNTDHITTIDENLINQLNEAESYNDYNIYKINCQNKTISDFLLERADRIFVVGHGNQPAVIDQQVTQLLLQSPAKYELILLYPQRTQPNNTRAWLQKFDFFRYHHLALEQNSDYERLIRFITGKAFGLVLSGGGTKGWVHMGVLKALHEAKIPLDAIGGTSIGAIIGAKYLMENDFDQFYQAMLEFARINLEPFRLSNLTYPLVSILNGKIGTMGVLKLFQKEFIENLWQPFFCVSYNMNQSMESIHRDGSLWLWTRASGAIPGIVPPIEVDGQLHVDGGVINNLPTDIMKDFFDGMGKILAVDLVYRDDKIKYRFPPVIKFWEAVKIKLGYKHSDYKFPEFSEVLIRSLLAGSAVKNQQNDLLADILFRPDLTKYHTLTESKRSDELFQIGYQGMQEKMNTLIELLKR